MRFLSAVALLCFAGCAPSLSANGTDRQDALRVAVVDVRAARSHVERAFSAMEAAAASNRRIHLIRANDRGLTFEHLAKVETVEATTLTALVEADAYLALEVEGVQHTFKKVYGPYGEFAYQAEAEAHLGVRVALPDGRVAVSRHLDGRAYGPHPFFGPQLQLTINDLPEQALDDALMRFIEDFGPL